MKGKYRRLMLGVSGYYFAISILIFALVNSSNVDASPGKGKARVAASSVESAVAAKKIQESPAKGKAPGHQNHRRSRVTKTELKNSSARRVVHISFKTQKEKQESKPASRSESPSSLFESVTLQAGGMDVALMPKEK